MGFQKYQKSENLETVTEEEKKVIGDHLNKTAKTSVSDMTDEEKDSLSKDLQKENDNA
jgi:hypothetical protein